MTASSDSRLGGSTMNVKKWISAVLCWSVVVFSPGLGCYSALAAAVDAGRADSIGGLDMPVGALGAAGASNMNIGSLSAVGINAEVIGLPQTDLTQGVMGRAQAAPAATAENSTIQTEGQRTQPVAALAPMAETQPAAPKGIVGAAANRLAALAKSVMPAKSGGGRS
ncbi:MAG: hypothetical protein ACYCPQ_06885 [Elusimicrobiota bacterium]